MGIPGPVSRMVVTIMFSDVSSVVVTSIRPPSPPMACSALWITLSSACCSRHCVALDARQAVFVVEDDLDAALHVAS